MDSAITIACTAKEGVLMSTFRTWLGTLLAACITQCAWAATTVESFSPEGPVKGVRQAVARFSGQMVPFGDLRLSDPFDVACPEKGTGRWVDGRNWSYDFERDLPAGVACTFTLKTKLADLAGKPLEGTRQFAFTTGGPSIIRSIPSEGQWDLDENAVFILGLDAVAKKESIEKNVYCRAEGVNEKIGVRFIEGAQRDELLALRRNFIDHFLTVYFKARGGVWKTTLALTPQRLDALPVVLLQCKHALPAESQVSLVWGAGVTSESGISTTEDQALAFRTRPDFAAKFSCQRINSKAQCIPFLPMTLAFTSPIRKQDAQAIRLTDKKGKVWQAVIGDDEAKNDAVTQVTFTGPFPERSSFTIAIPPSLKDDASRPLVNQARFPLAVATDDQPPLIKFPARFGIVEANADPVLPVTVRNVEGVLTGSASGQVLRVDEEDDARVIGWLKRLSGSQRNDWTIRDTWYEQMKESIFEASDEAKPFQMPKPNGRRAFEVIGIPLKKPGFYVVELESPKLGAVIAADGGKAYVQSSALVTNLAAHFKHGAESSIVWVTTLDKGQPVAGAKVAVRGCDGKALWQGTTDKSGVARIAGELNPKGCPWQPAFFVSARSDGDMTFTLSNWVGGIESWRFNVPTGSFNADNIMADTVFDRTLLRAGETVHMKHFLRKHTLTGIRLVSADETLHDKGGRVRRPGSAPTGPALALPGKLVITHQGTDQKYELPLKWIGDAGAAESTWKIPADAKQGMYSVAIGNFAAGSFRVEAFRVPTMKALLQGPKTPLVLPAKFDLDVQLNYLAGGGASYAPVKLRTVVEDKSVSFAGYDGVTFGNGDVKEGVVKETPGFDDEESGEDDNASGGATPGKAQTRSLQLDSAGAARIAIDKLPSAPTPRDVLAELEYQDANGETLAVSTRIALWPSKVVVGVKPDAWAVSKDAFKFQAIVLDLQGQPVANANVAVDFFQRVTYSHRRRLIGGFYAYENTSEVKRLGPACEGRTDAKGLLFCTVKSPATGNLILRAKATDDEGHATYANRDTWVAGSEDWWFAASDNDRIDVLAEQKRYEPGQSASFQVRMPFRSGTALVTVEREGVIDTYIKHLSGKNPTFSIPVKAQYAPNVYVSVFVVRGRVNGVQPTALVDLGKPAYKMGLAKLQVGWRAHELKVDVASDKPVYHVREKAKVRIKVARADGGALPAGAEVAVAAVDVGLLELMPNDSWNLLEAMMQQRPLQVETSTAQMEVIGKRHFGRKAVPHGGGGGKSAGRELFDTLLFWKARVVLDASGEANVDVPLNDSLTSFRIVAIASAGADRFGTGRIDIRSTQDLILLSGLPSLVREDDRFHAGFTLRNTTNGAVTVDVDANVTPDVAAKSESKLARQTVTIDAGQAKDVAWDYRVPIAVHGLTWDITAKARDGDLADKLRVKQKVSFAVPVRTYQATLMQVDKPISMTVQKPADALPGRGGVQSVIVPRLGNDLPGVREYMNTYPYTCFEQEASIAVALRDEKLWKAQMARLPAHLDSDGLVKYFPLMLYGSDSLTAYVLSVAAEAGYEIPESSKTRMEQALIGFVQGRVIRHSWLPTADVAIRKVAALEALSRSGLVTPDLLQTFALEPNLWPTSAVIDWYLVLERTPNLPTRDAQLAQAEQILRSRLNFQGTTMGFSTERRDDLWWLMLSPDVNANRVLLAMLDNERWHEDIGRIVRGTLGRQHKGRWTTTVANAWGTLAIEKFSAKFESVAVAGESTVTLGHERSTLEWKKRESGATFLQAWPKQSDQLTIQHAGAGKPWVTVQSLAAIPLKAPLSSGYRIAKTITPIEQKKPGVWSRGDVYRVHLDLEAQSDMTWVVVDDPIPASAGVLGGGLGRDSKIMASGEKRTGWVWPAFEERTFEAFRSYFEFVPKGKWSVEYTVRLNNDGDFSLPATRVEAMYSPEMFGEIPNAKFHVAP